MIDNIGDVRVRIQGKDDEPKNTTDQPNDIPNLKKPEDDNNSGNSGGTPPTTP